MATLGKAIAIASEAFKDKIDRGGKPYILHCLWVMNAVRHLGEVAMICAVLHDLVEDCEEEGYTFAYLREQEFSEQVLVILTFLTHRKGVSYDDYIKALALNYLAKEIKKRDIEHNSKITRLKGLRKKDLDRLEKYHRAYVYLSE